MLRTLTLAMTLLLPSMAIAADEMVPLNWQPPESIKMFQQLRLTKAVGKAKGHDCAAALADARADLARVMERAGMTDIAAIYTLNEREGWAPVSEVGCELQPKPDKVKKSVVKLEALVTMAGEGPAYTDISGVRATQIASAFVGDSTMMVALQLTQTRVEAQQDQAWYSAFEKHEEVFDPKTSRNTRAVVVFREDLLPRLTYHLELLTPIPEIHGVQFRADSQRKKKVDGEWKDVGETFHFFLPTKALGDFLGGTLTEQEMLDAGFVMHQETGPPVRMDISLVDAED